MDMGHDQDPGHGEPGHVHDEYWNRNMMRTDDTTRTDRTAVEYEEGGGEAIGAGAGALGGAAVGMAVGGPPGAVVGGAVGALGGAVAGEAAEGDDEAGAGTGALGGAAGGRSEERRVGKAGRGREGRGRGRG